MRLSTIILCVVMLGNISLSTYNDHEPLKKETLPKKARTFVKENKNWLIFTAIALPMAHFLGQLRSDLGATNLSGVEWSQRYSYKITMKVRPHLSSPKPMAPMEVLGGKQPAPTTTIRNLTTLGSILHWIGIV